MQGLPLASVLHRSAVYNENDSLAKNALESAFT
jgi:hypothetical protein